MSAKDIAIQDIKQDLEKNHKCFIAFHTELNPIMRRLVRQQLKLQHPVLQPSRANHQLVARCFFCKATNTVTYQNYLKYYGK